MAALISVNLLGLCLTRQVWAQSPPPPVAAEANFIAIGAAQIPEYEGADATRIVPFVAGRLPLFGGRLEIDGLQLRYDLIDSPVWRAGPAISATIPRGDFADSEPVAMLPSIGAGVELGAYAGFRVPFSAAKEGALAGYLFARRDVAGAHDGWLVTADVEYFFAAARALRFGIAANATFASDRYADTYYSVGASAAAISGLPSFDAEGGLKDLGLEAFSILSFSERSGVLFRAAVNRLQHDAADSPIVAAEGNRTQPFLGVAYFRRF